MPDRPRWKGSSFPFTAYCSDGRAIRDRRFQDSRTGAAVTVDFRLLGSKEDRTTNAWVQRSSQEPLTDRLVWVVGDPGRIEQIAKDLIRSRQMIGRYEGRRDSLPREKQRLLIDEQSQAERLETRLREAVAEAFLDGTLYFRGESTKPGDLGGSFATALTEAAKRSLPEMFPYFTEIAVTDAELSQLLEPQLSGASTKFMEDGLGILSLDAGKYVPSCSGDVPGRILAYLEQAGASGNALIGHFGRLPYGYPADVVSACLVGLLRAGRIRFRPEQGPEITSVKDPGAKDLFRKVKEGLGRADILPARETGVDARDRVAICRFFEDYLDLKLDRENDAIADAVFQQFPRRREALRQVESRLVRLPGRPEPPPALVKLGKALEACTRTRQVEEIVIAVKHNLDALRDGFQQLAIHQSELTDEAIDQVRRAADTRDFHLAQLRAFKAPAECADEAARLVEHLKQDRPWREIQDLAPAIDAIRGHYARTRRALINQQAREADDARARVKVREGFEKLTPDQSHKVLRPIREAIIDTDAEAVAPTLVELRNDFPPRLADAVERANDALDDELSDKDRREVVKVQVGLHGRELTSDAQLDAMLREIDERIRPLLKDRRSRVRIV
jgi:hypothetical protein